MAIERRLRDRNDGTVARRRFWKLWALAILATVVGYLVLRAL